MTSRKRLFDYGVIIVVAAVIAYIIYRGLAG